jgi:hypothetical protein
MSVASKLPNHNLWIIVLKFQEKIMSNSDKELKEKIQKLVLDAVQLDKELRDQYKMGDKFRFIRDRLELIRLHVEEELKILQQAIEDKVDRLEEGEVLIFVHLFNAQGIVFQTWQKMVSPSVFYEYSVNRPIYTEKAHIEAFIRSKHNKAQHGYLSVAIKKSDILPTLVGVEKAKDTIGNPVFKIKEGSLLFKKMFSFTHQEHEYVVNEAGQLVKK